MPPPTSISPQFTSPLLSSKGPANSKINRRNQAGETSLHRASAAGKLDDVRDLLDQGAFVNAQCNAGWTPLHKACLKGYAQIVRLLCENGARTDIRSNDEHDTPLHDACSNGHTEVVEILLAYGANPRVQNSQGNFPHEMVDDDLEVLKHIILEATRTFKEPSKKESAIDDREDSEPPQSPAIKRHSRRTSTASDGPIQQLTLNNGRPKRGAHSGRDDFLARDVHYRDPNRRGHLHLQALQGNGPFVRELLSIGASHTARDRDGNTPLHLAAKGGHEDVVQALLEYGADVNALNKLGETPLHEVSGRGHMDIVSTLLICGADPTIRDARGRTALDVAIESASTAAEGEVDLLKEKFVEKDSESLPLVDEEMNVKVEDSDEITEILEAVERKVPDVPEIVTNGRISLSPQPSHPSETVLSPGRSDLNESPMSMDLEVDVIRSVDAEGSTTVEDQPMQMDEVIQHEPIIPAIEEEPQEMEDDVSEVNRVPSPVPILEAISPSVKEAEVVQCEVPEPAVNEIPSEKVFESPAPAPEPEIALRMSVEPPSEGPDNRVEESTSEEVRQVSVPPPESESITTPVESLPETPIEVLPLQLPEEPQIPSVPPPEPRWTKLMSLESLPEHLEKEISQLLPIYTMHFRDSTETFVAHPQICSFLGFTSREFFTKCIFHPNMHSLTFQDPNIFKRALSNREKSRFCTPFVSLVSHLLTRLPPSEFETFMHDEFAHAPSQQEDLWHKFDKQRKDQFMAMSVYLLSLEQVRQILQDEFPALRELVEKNFLRLDTSDMTGEDEGVVYCEEEAERYIECWRRVAGKYASSAL